MFCPAASVVTPLAKDPANAPLLIQEEPEESSREHDVIIEQDESGNSFLHLVMPASSVNFLNGYDGDSLFNLEEDPMHGQEARNRTSDKDYDQMLVEVGCKVYEVNKVLYKSRAASPDPAPDSPLKFASQS